MPLLVSPSSHLYHPVFDGVGLVDFKSRANLFLLVSSVLFIPLISNFLTFMGWFCGVGVFGLYCSHSLQPCIANSFLISIIARVILILQFYKLNIFFCVRPISK